MFYNTTDQPHGASSFLEVLPYHGDGRGTVLAKPLSDVRVRLVAPEPAAARAGETAPAAVRVFATDTPPATIPNDVSSPAHVDGTVRWCQIYPPPERIPA